jgi:hypothetical protein
MDTTSTQVEDDVRTQIAGDPRIAYPAEIAVTGVTSEIRVDDPR